MLNFITKLYQSIIARDQLVKLFSKHNGIDHCVHRAVSGYDVFENQMDALGHSRKYRKIALQAEIKAKGKQLPEKFFFRNFSTRDLVEAPAVGTELEQTILSIVFKSALNTLLKVSNKVFNELPPPLKSSLIPDINLTARLLPAPATTSA